MRVLVTGHNGFIGSVMVPLLQGRGVDVVGMAGALTPDLPREVGRVRSSTCFAQATSSRYAARLRFWPRLTSGENLRPYLSCRRWLGCVAGVSK